MNNSHDDYQSLIAGVIKIAGDVVPTGATVAVVSKGDDELIKLPGAFGHHFPHNEHGAYAGHYPLDSDAAIAQLEADRKVGAKYLLIPASNMWWLDYYKQFAACLHEQAELVWKNETCWIFRLDRRLEAIKSKSGSSKTASTNVADSPAATTQYQTFRTEPVAHLRFVLDYPETLPLVPLRETAPFNPKAMSLHWILPDFTRGMGGPAVIFRMIKYLEDFGHQNTIWIHGVTREGSVERAREVINQHYTPINASVRMLQDKVDDLTGDAVIASQCWTAYPARAVTRVRERFYMVQDFEPQFHPMGSEYFLAEDTYRFGFSCITSSWWLQDLMRSRYSARADRFAYAYDRAIYHEDSTTPRLENRIAFYARSSTPRRAVELGLLSLELLARRGQSFEVDFFGESARSWKFPFAHKSHGVLDDRQLAALYRSATLGLVLSSTNYSLIPHEMMGCGLPVVELNLAGTASEFPRDAITLSEPTPQALARNIENLLNDSEIREAQTERARQYVRKLSWEASARQFERALVDGIIARERQTASSSPAVAGKIELPDRKRSASVYNFRGPVVFAGQPEYYRSVHYDMTSTGEHFEFPYTSGDPSVLRELPTFARAHGARTCIIFRPEWLAPYPQAFWELKEQGIAVIGYSTEPIPQARAGAHSDQLKRLETLRKATRLPYDLVIHFDPSSLAFLTSLHEFRDVIAHPLPVSQKLFYPQDLPRDFDLCFLGKSTAHREAMLGPLKMRFNLVHVAHGLRDEEARMLMNRSKIVLNLHNEAYPNFENRVIQALFCQRPVVSEPLSGGVLTEGNDYIAVSTPEQLMKTVVELLTGHNVPSPTFAPSAFTLKALLQRLGIGAA